MHKLLFVRTNFFNSNLFNEYIADFEKKNKFVERLRTN